MCWNVWLLLMSGKNRFALKIPSFGWLLPYLLLLQWRKVARFVERTAVFQTRVQVVHILGLAAIEEGVWFIAQVGKHSWHCTYMLGKCSNAFYIIDIAFCPSHRMKSGRASTSCCKGAAGWVIVSLMLYFLSINTGWRMGEFPPVVGHTAHLQQ